MVYNNCKIYGPYQSKDKRLRVVIKLLDGKLKTVSYPKYLMECHLQRYLEENETVDHIDRNFLNNDIANLRVLDRKEHIKLDSVRIVSQKFICPLCGSEFELGGRLLHSAIGNRNKGKAGPFCGRRCAGKYGKNVQMTGMKLDIELIKPQYTTLKLQSITES